MTCRKLLLFCLLAVPALAQKADVAGEWRNTSEYASDGWIFSADGRFASFDSPDGSYQFGHYRCDGDRLALQYPSGAVEYRFQRGGAELTLTSEDAVFGSSTTSYARGRDSAARIAAVLSAPAADAIPGLLSGRWDRAGEYESSAYVFLPDGRYLQLEDEQATAFGRYQLGEGRLIFCGLDGQLGYDVGLEFFGPILQLSTLMLDGSSYASHYRKNAQELSALEAAWPQPSPEDLAARLPGRWHTGPDGFLQQQFSFHPAGHCLLQDDISTSFGRWRVEGGQLFVADVAGFTHEYTLTFFGELLFISLRTELGDELAYACTFEQGSRAVVERELALAPADAFPEALLGCWQSAEELLDITWIFVDDRYYYSSDGVASRGQIALQGEELKVWNRAEGAAVYPVCWRLGERQLVLVGTSSLGERTPMVFWKTDDSADDVRAWAEEVEAEKRAADTAWRERIAVGPRRAGGSFPGLGDVPADPQPEFVYEDGQVFAELEGYSWQGLGYEVQFGPNAGNIVYDRTDWYFLPNGRVYQLVRSQGASPPLVQGVWGRYKIEGERITWGVPGEEQILELEDGRRNLYNPENQQHTNSKAIEAALSGE